MTSPAKENDLREEASIGPASSTSVLLVDHDPSWASDCARMLHALGYRYHQVASARDALEKLICDPTIQIIQTNVEMPGMDGFELVKEARARAGNGRPIAAILHAATATPELAIQGLHIEAVDLLCKPFILNAYSASLRRAMRYLAKHRPIERDLDLSKLSQQISELILKIDRQFDEIPETGNTSSEVINTTLNAIITLRNSRGRFFPVDLFADPAWDILLDLMRAELSNKEVSVSSASIAASVPMTTALRWVRQMTERGMLKRWTDPNDRRRDLITLSDETATQMRNYLNHAQTIIKRSNP